jgi:deoxyribodipyrimidine photo-lyase
MRLASWCCHWARLDWKMCADRTYYYFIDGELSANHLSWQWVNSTFANKPYFMNEDNLQKYWS